MRFFHVGPVQAIFSALRFHTQGLDRKNTHTGRPNIHLFKLFFFVSFFLIFFLALLFFFSFLILPSYPLFFRVFPLLSLFLSVLCSKLSKVGKSADLLTAAFERGPQKGDENSTEVHR